MNTEAYIHQFYLKQQGNIKKSFSEKVNDWIYRHPLIVKTAEVAGMVLGLASVLLLPITFSALRGRAVALALIGGFVGLVSFKAYRLLDILFPPHHSMKSHVFKPAEYGAGKIYYQGHIPILELQSDDPYQAGEAHGYLMGQYLDQLLNKMDLVKDLAHLPQAKEVSKTLKKINKTLPQEYLEELKGVADGFNRWAKQNYWFKHRNLTVNDLILFHLMPDSIHFSPKEFESNLKNKKAPLNASPNLANAKKNALLGCTVVIDQDDEKGLTFGRNMDWPSFGLFGTYSLIIHRKHKNQKLSSVELGFPGFVGTLTGMNAEGLSLAMNVCSGDTKKIEGMPAAFYNRFCLENCHDVKELERKIDKASPLGSYHLSASDAACAKSFHFNQGQNGEHVKREKIVDEPLITTNCQYLSHQAEIKHRHNSVERKKIIQDLFHKAKSSITAGKIEKEKLVKASLSLPYVNNSITTQTIVMYPQSKKICLAVDNAFSANAKLEELNIAI